MTEERMARLEGAYEQVDKRLGDLDRSIGALRGDMNTLRIEVRGDINTLRTEVRGEINSLRNEINSRFNQQWTVMRVAWATLMAAVLASIFTS